MMIKIELKKYHNFKIIIINLALCINIISCFNNETGKNAFDVIPESFESVISCLSTMSLINAQEFMIQLAVQTNKSPSLTAKLSSGVSMKLKQCQKLLYTNLSQQIYQSIKKDISYLKIRSDLYQSIALKYHKLLKTNEKHGECVAYYQSAINILNHASINFKIITIIIIITRKAVRITTNIISHCREKINT